DVAHHPFQNEVTHLLDCIIDDKRPEPDIDHAAQTMAICIAADTSAESGRPVKVAEV
ncbi:MAG: gfo/Idh/MocA family oxidoreductase, partial [bacterium]|nr:gfo/Idh/MocA family oxidoreductase [bacterium]